MDGFREMVDFCSLFDFKAVGPMFTWSGIRWGELVKVRLDRFLVSSEWLDCFPCSRAINLKSNQSDHLPILIEIRSSRSQKRRRKQRFHFEECWLYEEECRKMVELGWSSGTGTNPFSTICNKIANTRDVLLE
ncbi:uncharacterized protein LOC112164555 [Rosa chinensis]|uniref:uncharacterized protein LOC112164555 n=1 Tax=Rosa chinensis TaxID=74649 RepID=UPI000D087CBC|nr:uncharacterized protein LOC112164555 [Rosa chinensis]